MANNKKYMSLLQGLIIKGVATSTKYLPKDVTIKLLKSEFTHKPVIGRKIALRPTLSDGVILTAKTDACIGRYAQYKEQHRISKICYIPTLEAIVSCLYNVDEVSTLANIVKVNKTRRI